MVHLQRYLVLIVFIGLLPPAAAEFRTPDAGTTYTLATLSDIAPASLEQTAEGFLLKEKLIVSGSDALVARDGSLFIVPIDPENTERSILVIEGRLVAENLVVRTNGEVLEDYLWGNGILVKGNGNQGMAEASITSCTFQKLSSGVTIRAGAKAVIEGSRFQDCTRSGVYVYMQAEAHIMDTKFHNAHVFFLNSRGTIQNCHFLDSNVDLWDLKEDFSVNGCYVEGVRDNGVFIYNGSGVKLQDCTISGYHYGIALAGNASPTLLRNKIKDNLEGGMVIGDQAAPVLRQNRITGNAVNPPSTNGSVILPALFILDDATPDLGTSVTLGKNTFQDNGPLVLYNAGPKRIFAQGNYWGTRSMEEVEDMIYHKPDDDEDADESGFLSGLVEFAPLWEPIIKGVLFFLY